jgi:hypothetical protein
MVYRSGHLHDVLTAVIDSVVVVSAAVVWAATASAVVSHPWIA